MNEQQRYEQARSRVAKLRQFYGHLAAYVLVNAGLIILNLILGTAWFIWPLFGWGIGLAAHAVTVFGIGRFLSADWEEQQIRRMMERGE